MLTTFASSVTRTELALPDLNLNDHLNYIVVNQILGAQVQWRRQAVTSPFIEGQYTVGRVRDVVTDKFAVQVLGADQATMFGNLQALLAAFNQDYFNLSITLDNQMLTFACEASVYTVDFSQERIWARQMLVTFDLRRQPISVNGPF